jgi:hypothetical protein
VAVVLAVITPEALEVHPLAVEMVARLIIMEARERITQVAVVAVQEVLLPEVKGEMVL